MCFKLSDPTESNGEVSKVSNRLQWLQMDLQKFKIPWQKPSPSEAQGLSRPPRGLGRPCVLQDIYDGVQALQRIATPQRGPAGPCGFP